MIVKCKECGTSLEVDESLYEKGASYTTICSLCGTKVSFTISEEAVQEDTDSESKSGVDREYCPKCGTSMFVEEHSSIIKSASPSESLQANPLLYTHVADKDTNVEKQATQKNNNTIWIVVFSVIISVIIITSVFFFLSYGKESSTNDEVLQYEDSALREHASLTMKLSGKIGGEAVFVMEGNSGWYSMTYNGSDRTKRLLELESYNIDNNDCIINAYLNNNYIGKFVGVVTRGSNNQVEKFNGIFESVRGSRIDFNLHSE